MRKAADHAVGLLMGDLAVYNVDLVTYRFLLLAGVTSGLTGGQATLQSTIMAFVSDATPDGSRAPIFSVMNGLLFAGQSLVQ